MNKFNRQGQWVIWSTCLIAVILQGMPWPKELHSFRPSWVTMVLIFWVMTLPHRVNVGTAFILGIILDLRFGSILGIHATSLSLVAYLVALKSRSIDNLVLWQQAFVIGFLAFFASAIVLILGILFHPISLSIETLLSIVVDGIVWIWLYLLLSRVRRSFGIQ